MLDWMPADIQQQYGEVEDTVHDGPQLMIDPEQEAGVVDALEKQGYICIKDEVLAEISVRNSSASYEQKWS